MSVIILNDVVLYSIVLSRYTQNHDECHRDICRGTLKSGFYSDLTQLTSLHIATKSFQT
jgi:hypothetical protein